METALPLRTPGRFFRYQFDNAAQLRRHCRLVDGRVLLFFPEERPALAPGSRALIELCISGSEQQVALPAIVHSRELYRRPGTWLELRALAVVAGLQSAVAEPRRMERRLALDQLAWVNHEGGPVLACPVLDISRSGARLWGVPGGTPAAGERIRVRLQHSSTMIARIAWAHGREVGIEVTEESLPAAAQLYARVEAQWAAARFARHDPSCTCTGGGDPLDPPPPVRSAFGRGLR